MEQQETSPNLSSRESVQRKIANALDYLGENYNIIDKSVRDGDATTMDIARSFTGDIKSDKLIENLGLLDVTPFGTYFAAEEGQDAINKAEPDAVKRSMALLNYMRQPLQTIIDRPEIGLPATDIALGGIEAIPFGYVVTKPIKTFLKSLKSKVPTTKNNSGMITQQTSLPTSGEANTTTNIAENKKKFVATEEFKEKYDKRYKNENFNPETYFHVTRKDFDTFNPESKRGEGLGNFESEDPTDATRGASYFTSDKEYLNELTEDLTENFGSKGLRIMPVKIKMKNIFYGGKNQFKALREALENSSLEELKEFNRVKDIQEEKMGKFTLDEFFIEMQYATPYTFENPIIRKKMKELGFTGYTTNEPDTVALFNPDKGDVRSVFAKFDPDKVKDGNIMATIIPPTTLGALSTIEKNSEQEVPQT